MDALCGYLVSRLKDRHRPGKRNDDGSSAMMQIAPAVAGEETPAQSKHSRHTPAPKHRQRHVPVEGSGGYGRPSERNDANTTNPVPQKPSLDVGFEACKEGDLAAVRCLIESGRFDPASARDRFGGS